MSLSLVLLASLAVAPADTAGLPPDTLPAAHVTVTFGGEPGEAVRVRDFEFGLTNVPDTRHQGGSSAATQVRMTREPDALTSGLASRVASGERIPEVVARLERAGSAPIVLRMFDVQVVSERLLINGDNAALTQQRLGLEESIAQLTAEQGEADRQLAAIESLARERLSPPLEVARVRSNAAVVAKRLGAQRQRMALVEGQLARWVPIQEEVVLSASRTTVESR